VFGWGVIIVNHSFAEVFKIIFLPIIDDGACPRARVAGRERRQVRARRVRRRLGFTIREGFRRKVMKE